jgi:hypothetical protein
MVRKGGHKTEKGTYWSIMTGEKIVLEQEGMLPGSGTYLKAPTALILLAGPVLGLVYAIFLPFIAIAMTIGVVAKKVAEGSVHVASFGWRPVEVYLAGGKKGRRAKRDDGKREDRP